MASRFTAPPLTIDEILTRLVERYRMVEAADIIRAPDVADNRKSKLWV